MIIGLLSDTHGKAAIAAQAVQILLAADARYLIHCGDVGEGVIESLARLPSAFVFGNNDFDRQRMATEAQLAGVKCLGDFGELELAGKRIAVAHGDIAHYVNKVIDGAQHDYLFTGHTHLRHDLRVGTLRRINPGALHRAHPKTVATLDLSTDTLRWLEVDEGPVRRF
ncbi:MAG: metallophosphoesterase family protein [Tepidisphaeraceae bacterium]